jgi:hypothetical protein
MHYPFHALRFAHEEIRGVVRAETTVHERLRDRVMALAIATLGVDLICAVLAYLFEHDVKGTEIKNFGSAIFWTTTQLLTISSSMVNPLSVGGRILDVFMQIWAVVVITSLAGALGAFFVHKAEESKVHRDVENPRAAPSLE